MKTTAYLPKFTILFALTAFISLVIPSRLLVAATMNDYCNVPPFIAQSVPPLVMFDVARDHKLFFQAYNDAADIDDDGQIDTGYKHSIDYYGYFDPYKCYVHTGGTTASDEFDPVSQTADKFCSSGQWSGNVLNWMTMTRIDVLRKVLYGGYRSTDSSSSTVLQKQSVFQDAHSFGKELTGRLCSNGSTYTYTCVDSNDCDSGFTCVDKSQNLIGFAAADAPTTCSGPVTVNWDTTNSPGNILIAKYSHPNHTGTCGDYNVTVTPDPNDPLAPPTITVNDTIYGSFEVSTANYMDSFYVSDFNYTDSSASNRDVIPTKDHGDDYNIFAVAEFNVTNSNKGNWQFLLDSDDGSELLIDGQMVTIYPGCHAACFTGTQFPPPATVTDTTVCGGGSAYGTAPGTSNLTSGWHRLLVRQSEANGQDGIRVWYKKPGDANWTIFGNTLSLRAPAINSGNVCSIKSPYFIDTGTPVAGTAKRHLFCSTTRNNDTNQTPLLRVVKSSTHRIWEWSAKERPVCDSVYSDNTTISPAPTDYAVRVQVCNSTVGLESNCKNYSGTYKPAGLMQKYGEGDGTKVCSKDLSTPCNSDTNCGAGQGICIYRAPMYFGLLTGSYTHNHQGGVLRKNVASILDEVNTNGIIQTSANVPGNIIDSLNKLQIIDFSGGVYQNCGWLETRAPNDGECRMWGNPIAEMLYETLRYFAGKGAATTAYDYSTNSDAGVGLSHPDWGKFNAGSNTYKPYDVYPWCSKPFILLLSDVNSSYDADQLPNSPFGSFTEDANLPLLNMQTATLANTIGTTEGISGNNWFVGKSGTVSDTLCSPKNVTNLSQVLGICPEEPTKQGSFFAAAVAYYGKTLFNTNTGNPNVNTFAVALASPFPDMKFKVGSSFVSIVPTGKSADGCLSVSTACWNNCTASTIDANGLHLSCNSSAFCPTNQIVNVFMDRVEYDSQNNVIYAKFRINFEDSEQGADFDMDAIVSYEICTPSSANMAGTTCNDPLGPNQIEIKLSSDYAAGCIDQALGFIISGTTADGTYLAVKDRDVGSSSRITSLGLTWQKTFTVNSTGPVTGFLHDPLWYAAKWGGFNDKNSNNIPDQVNEWAKNDGTNPDNYYLVVNPLKLEQQLDKALSDILARVSSGTAASILSSSEGSGANILQAVFYPIKIFDNNTEAAWTGEIQNLWYYIDPKMTNSSIREDTVADNILNLQNDNIVRFIFDTKNNQTYVQKLQDSNGDGVPEVSLGSAYSPDDVQSLWKAGKLLWQRNITSNPRSVYTTINGSSLLGFTAGNATSLKLYLQAADDTEAAKIINYINGADQPGYRGRTVQIGSDSNVWKLGDVIDSTPRLQSSVRLNVYDSSPPQGYGDSTYYSFINSTDYLNRGMAYVGGNDGMLHAFKLGVLNVNMSGSKKAKLSGTGLGEEQWAYVPRNSLPYLKYLTDPNYNHIYYVDSSTTLADVSSEPPSGCSGSYESCVKTSASWKTVLIGGMGLGGASRSNTAICTDCVKAPISDPADSSKGLGYSSYFAMDVTDPANPKLLWEFSDPSLGYSMVGPSFIRIGPSNLNGKWFVVLASGPTGPIDTSAHQFLGRSDQSLKLFVLDLKTGQLLRTIDTGTTYADLQNAFAGSLTLAGADTDRWNPGSTGFYSDDALYVGYVKKVGSGTSATWTDGGILRLMTKEDPDPTNWAVSKVIDGIGPVTTAISKLQDRKNRNLWLYFGAGRYFYRTAALGIDDSTGQRKIFGIKEPCYNTSNNPGNYLDKSCTASPLGIGDLTNKTTGATDDLSSKGWYINLDPSGTTFTDPNSGSTTTYSAERIVTDPVALPTGVVFFTSFKPSADICGFGGGTYVWAVKYDTGFAPPDAALEGKLLMQLSTGAFVEKDLSTAFTSSENRKTPTPDPGKPPAAPPTFVTKPGAGGLKKILRIQER